MKNMRYVVTISSFFILVLFFFINQSTNIVSDIDYDENKKKNEKPIFNINYLDNYPKQYEAYLSDNFSLRGLFLKYIGDINTNLWKKSPKPDKLIIGKEKWLFNVDKELNFYLGKTYFTDEELQIILDEFLYRKETLHNMGIEMHMVINPTKYSVFPEYLPAYMNGSASKNIADQLIEYFRENSSIEIIYPKDTLLSLKNEAELYYKGDNHWNGIGAYYAAEYIAHKIYSCSIVNLPLESFDIDTVYNWKGNLAHMTANANNFAENRYDLKLKLNDAEEFNRNTFKPIEGFVYAWDYQKSYRSRNDSLPDALIIRDSFGNALIPYMKNTFYHSTFIFDAWHYGFNLDIIRKENPDVVVYMVLESLLPNIITHGITSKNN